MFDRISSSITWSISVGKEINDEFGRMQRFGDKSSDHLALASACYIVGVEEEKVRAMVESNL